MRTMALMLSRDHRAIAGARGAQFLSARVDLVEQPFVLLTHRHALDRDR
jgi:pyruvate/2-oxoglutarate dehydrogenase complex dihydrolipoamide acyltransferase (E2) component